MGDHIVTRFYSLYSFATAVSAWPELMSAINARLEPFAVGSADFADYTEDIDSALTLSFQEGDPRSLMPEGAPAGRRVYDFRGGQVLYDDACERLTITVGSRICALCEPATGHAKVVAESPGPSDLYVLSHPVLSLLLMELLKCRGLYPVHAAGLALNGHGVLLAGTSGAGKSTLSLALARRGFSFLSDDTVFVDGEASGWRVRAFPDQIDLCPDTVKMFPELAQDASEDLPPAWPKRQVRAETVYDSPISWAAPARVLIFPSVCGTATSTIRPVSPEDALLELVPNVLLTDAGRSQGHLDALAGLASQCACYRLDTGRDLDDAVAVVRQVVA
jgi:hypothetical protein